MSQINTELVANGEMSEDVDVDKLHGANLDALVSKDGDGLETDPKHEPPSGLKAEADTDDDAKPNSVHADPRPTNNPSRVRK